METTTKRTAMALSSETLLAHYQGHRNLTRRTIEAFPEKEFFSHNIGGMRTFAEMVMELLGIAGPGLQEIVSEKSAPLDEHVDHGNSKAKILKLWDEATEQINVLWPQIPTERFQEKILLFGMYEGTIISSILYFIDNEIHHRGQGFVYLRSLGIEPPAFYER